MQKAVSFVHHNPVLSHEPSAVLVFCWLEDGVVWVQHPVRGWEVPGGKVEPGESPEEAAHREVYEECGVFLEALTWIGEYALDATASDGTIVRSYKWVYTGSVRDAGARPVDSEIMDVCVRRPPWTPEDVQYRPDVSYVMKDRAFADLWPLVAGENRT